MLVVQYLTEDVFSYDDPSVDPTVSRLSRLKFGGRRSEKAGLEGRKDVCIVVQETCYYEHNACRQARLGSVQAGNLLLIG